MPELEVLQRRLEREKQARKQAESLLEEKSRELYVANQEMHHAALALKEQSDRSAAIVDHAAEGIVTFDGKGLIDAFNPAAERIFGVLAKEALGRQFHTFFNASSMDELLLLHSKSAEQEKKVQLGQRKDGSQFPVDVVTSSFVVQEKKVHTAIIRDMTKRHELEQQLAHAQKLESIGHLAAGIAHEINTPIQYVGDNAQFLSEAFEDLEKLLAAYGELEKAVQGNEIAMPCIEKVTAMVAEVDLDFLKEEIPSAIRQSIDGTERVAQIVRAMKDFAHPSQQEKTATNINQAIESTITVCRNEWKYIAELELDLDPELPLVNALAGELNQAILNLVVNGAHAIQEKLGESSAEKGTIRVVSRRCEEGVEIRISDTGTGIPPDLLEKIFDPFFTTKGVGRGTGQGLAIAYNAIVEKHGGQLKVESAVGVGTAFVIQLPQTDVSTSQPAGEVR